MPEIIMSAIGGAGLGVIGQSIVQHFLSKSAVAERRRLDERKEAYAQFLDALLQVKGNPDVDEKEVKLLYWASRVQLVCSENVYNQLEQVRTSGRRSATGKLTTDILILAMRDDLQVVKRKSWRFWR